MTHASASSFSVIEGSSCQRECYELGTVASDVVQYCHQVSVASPAISLGWG